MNSNDGPDASSTLRAADQTTPSTASGRRAAFFDLDNTLVRGSSLFPLAKGLYARNYFELRLIWRALWLEFRFRSSGREHHGHIDEVQQRFLEIIKDKHAEQVAADTAEIYRDAIAPKIWPQTRALVGDHLSAGDDVWLVTAAPEDVARVAARELGMTGGLGSAGEQNEGRYTGRLNGQLLHGAAKAGAVQALAERCNYDLASSHAYSDSSNDLPMLNLVGFAHAVNPDSSLRALALSRGWPVHDFRRALRRRQALLASGAVGAALGAAVVAFPR